MVGGGRPSPLRVRPAGRGGRQRPGRARVVDPRAEWARPTRTTAHPSPAWGCSPSSGCSTRSLLACALLEILREDRVAGRPAVILRPPSELPGSPAEDSSAGGPERGPSSFLGSGRGARGAPHWPRDGLRNDGESRSALRKEFPAQRPCRPRTTGPATSRYQTHNPWVGGSSPPRPTIRMARSARRLPRMLNPIRVDGKYSGGEFQGAGPRLRTV